MEIMGEKDKRDLLECLEVLGKGIPILDMDDRDYVASLLYRMAQIVREHGPSHGVSLNSPVIDEMSIVKEPEDRRWFTVAGRRCGKTMYQAELWAALREAEDRKKAVSGFKLDEGDIKKVIYNPPATIIYWKDGTKTVVKCSDHDYDEGRMTPETGLVYAIAKKVLGNKGNYNDVLRRLVKRAKKS